MSFDLAIAVKRDPGKGAGPEPVMALAKTLVFEASGALSHDGAAALAEAIDEAVSPEFRDYIVRFQSITDVDTMHCRCSRSGCAVVKIKALISGSARSSLTCTSSLRSSARLRAP